MKKQNFTHSYCRTVANELAAKANKFFNKAKEADSKFYYYDHKVYLIRNFLLNSPWLLFTILYFSILIVDAVFMKPIIQVVVQHGFRMQSDFSLYLFISIYILLIGGLTIGVAYGFSKYMDKKLRELQVEMDSVSRPFITKSVIEDEIQKVEYRERNLGIIFGILLSSLLISLSLYRNYIVNEFQLKFDSPDDWLNIIIPIALGVALCFFGLYKDIVVKLLWFKNKRNSYEELRDIYQANANNLTRQSVEQDNEAIKKNESIQYSADLNEVIKRYENQSISDGNYYDNVKSIEIILMAKGIPVPNVQIAALTGDSDTIFATSGTNGKAIVTWVTESDFIKNLRIGPYNVNGNRWLNGSVVSIDLEDFIYTHNSKQNNNSYLENRIVKSQN